MKISIKGSLEMELGPNLAIFNLRIMYGLKRVIVFALKNNYELIVCKNRVMASVHISLLFSLLSVQHTG